jgi:hypothetical protein
MVCSENDLSNFVSPRCSGDLPAWLKFVFAGTLYVTVTRLIRDRFDHLPVAVFVVAGSLCVTATV